MNNLLEICIDSVESGIIAERSGADMVELCANLYEGGTTPGYGTLELARKNLSFAINVMIRPRGGDFLYSNLEFEIMKQDIAAAKNTGIDGVVFGILLPDGEIDIPRTLELAELARPMRVTFHRAFDMTPDPFRSLEAVIEAGADRLLTAGHSNHATDNPDLIGKLIEKAGNRIVIMPGSGIDENNLAELISRTSANEYHCTGRGVVESSMIFRKDGIFMGGLKEIPEYTRKVADNERISRLKKILDEH